jgi:hypothetical protein
MDFFDRLPARSKAYLFAFEAGFSLDAAALSIATLLRQILAMVKPTTIVTIAANAILVMSGVAPIIMASSTTKKATEATMLRLHFLGGDRGRFNFSYIMPDSPYKVLPALLFGVPSMGLLALLIRVGVVLPEHQ